MERDEIEHHPSEFFRREYQRLVGYVRSLLHDSPEAEAEDLVQEAMYSLFRRIHITGPVEDLAAYVYGTLKNRIIDAYRARGRRESLFSSFPIQEDGEENLQIHNSAHDDRFNPAILAEGAELRHRIEEEIETLPPPLRAAFRLVELEGLTHREMAEELGVPLGTALSWKHRAVEILRSRLRDIRSGSTGL